MTNTPCSLILAYFPANQRWRFLFGRDVETASLITLEGFDPSFATRKEAVAAARYRGLSVARNGVCSVA